MFRACRSSKPALGAVAASAAVLLAHRRRSAAASTTPPDSQSNLVHKLACHRNTDGTLRAPCVLLACGSFNPPTRAHADMFERAREHLLQVCCCQLLPRSHSAAHGTAFMTMAVIQATESEHEATLHIAHPTCMRCPVEQRSQARISNNAAAAAFGKRSACMHHG